MGDRDSQFLAVAAEVVPQAADDLRADNDRAEKKSRTFHRRAVTDSLSKLSLSYEEAGQVVDYVLASLESRYSGERYHDVDYTGAANLPDVQAAGKAFMDALEKADR